ncbi:MAG TPA: AMP-binding protein [Amycolatopsis sp.]|nr:AMP-binding protein [Amycolatopsis sp.]
MFPQPRDTVRAGAGAMTTDIAARNTFVTADDAREYLRAGYWSADETLPSVLARHAAARPDHLAVTDDLGQRITYGQLHRRSSRLAEAIRARGVGPGDVVGVQLPNRVEASVAALAIEKAGAVVCPMVTPYRRNELAYAVERTGMKLLFVPGSYRGFDHDALGRELMRDLPSLRTVVTLSTQASDPIPFGDFLDSAGDGTAFDEPDTDPDAVAAVLFTSGTESAPKGILHTTNTLLANARALRRMLGLTEDDGVFMASPVGHGTGYGFGIRLACYLGSTLSLLGVWNAERAAKMLQEHGAAYTHGATPFVLDLLSLPRLHDYDFSRLRFFVTGGAAVPPGTATRVRDRLGCRLLRLYGQTEGFMTTLSPVTGDPADAERSDGVPVDGVEVRAVDGDDQPVPAGEPGECQYRGPHRCVGFLNDPVRERANLTGTGWFRSGDLVSIAEDGHLTVAGRKKEVINRGGYKYSPREVEDVLTAHPGIERVAVVKMADPRLVERACAFVVPAPGSAPTVSELADYLKAHGIASFKWPERVELVTEFPATASGKVQKFELERLLDRKLAAEQGREEGVS